MKGWGVLLTQGGQEEGKQQQILRWQRRWLAISSQSSMPFSPSDEAGKILLRNISMYAAAAFMKK